MRLVALSDTHNKLHLVDIPDGDILIHAGDLTGRGSEKEIIHELDVLAKQNDKFQDTIIINGNHDFLGEEAPDTMERLCRERDITYLNDSGIEINGIKFWGSPITPWFRDWAFNRRYPKIKDHWDKIPMDTKILITHGPPYEILDQLVFADGTPKPEFAGCWMLRDRIKEIKPKVHIFGHIHCGHGYKQEDGTNYYNVSICDEQYSPSNPVTVIDYEKL